MKSQSKKVVRHDVLWKLLQEGMKRSRQSLNTSQLVEDSYDEEAMSLFDNKEMLVGAMDDMLDALHRQVLEEDMPTYMKEQKIAERLTALDALERRVIQAEEAQAQAEWQDQQSAHDSMNLLPEGVRLEDVLLHQKYHDQLQQKQQLEEALAAVQEDVARLQEEQDVAKENIQGDNRSLQRYRQELVQSADACSMIL